MGQHQIKRGFSCLIVAMIAWGLFAPELSAKSPDLKRSQPLLSSGIFNDADGNAMDYGVWVYGVILFARSANTIAEIKDCDSGGELTGTPNLTKDELGQPTQYETTEHSYVDIYGRPFYFSDGVGANISGVGTVIVIYEDI